jgi:hypothetical protein
MYSGVPYYVDGADPRDFSEAELSKVTRGLSVHGMKGVFQGKEFDNYVDNHDLFVDHIYDKKGKKYIILRHDKPMMDRAAKSFADGEESLPRGSTVDTKILYFNNTWTGNSWAKNIDLRGGGAPCFWTKNYSAIEHQVDRDWMRYEERWPGRSRRVAYDKYKTFDLVMDEVRKFLVEHIYEPEIHIWIQGVVEGMDFNVTVAKIRAEIERDDTLKDETVNQDYIVAYKRYWETNLMSSLDVWFTNAYRNPSRIATIPWRTCTHGMRSYGTGLNPQLYPSTTLRREMGLNVQIEESEVYSNYSGYVELVPLTKSDIENLDFAWLQQGNSNNFKMRIPTDDNYKSLFKVEDPKFFLGLGSVAIGQHSCYGIGRSAKDLYEQYERKRKTGHGTSGHMITSVLCFRSHFLWYLEEIMYNNVNKKSIYNLPFKEPEGGLYHSIQEYKHAIYDMKELLKSKGVYPNYVLGNYGICRSFVEALE